MTETTKEIPWTNKNPKRTAMDPMHQVQLDSSYNDPWPRSPVGVGWKAPFGRGWLSSWKKKLVGRKNMSFKWWYFTLLVGVVTPFITGRGLRCSHYFLLRSFAHHNSCPHKLPRLRKIMKGTVSQWLVGVQYNVPTPLPIISSVVDD